MKNFMQSELVHFIVSCHEICCINDQASFPGPRPASCRLQYGPVSDGNLGEGAIDDHHKLNKDLVWILLPVVWSANY